MNEIKKILLLPVLIWSLQSCSKWELIGLLGLETQIEADSTVFAVIGDFGLAGEAEERVANLVKSWDPDFIITTGDNNYQSGVSTLRIDKPQIIVSRAQALLDNTIVYGVGITAIPLILSDNHHHPSYNSLDLDNDLIIEVESINVMKQLVLVHGKPMIITIKMWKTTNPQI